MREGDLLQPGPDPPTTTTDTHPHPHLDIEKSATQLLAMKISKTTRVKTEEKKETIQREKRIQQASQKK